MGAGSQIRKRIEADDKKSAKSQVSGSAGKRIREKVESENYVGPDVSGVPVGMPSVMDTVPRAEQLMKDFPSAWDRTRQQAGQYTMAGALNVAKAVLPESSEDKYGITRTNQDLMSEIEATRSTLPFGTNMAFDLTGGPMGVLSEMNPMLRGAKGVGSLFREGAKGGMATGLEPGAGGLEFGLGTILGGGAHGVGYLGSAARRSNFPGSVDGMKVRKTDPDYKPTVGQRTGIPGALSIEEMLSASPEVGHRFTARYAEQNRVAQRNLASTLDDLSAPSDIGPSGVQKSLAAENDKLWEEIGDDFDPQYKALYADTPVIDVNPDEVDALLKNLIDNKYGNSDAGRVFSKWRKQLRKQESVVRKKGKNKPNEIENRSARLATKVRQWGKEIEGGKSMTGDANRDAMSVVNELRGFLDENLPGYRQLNDDYTKAVTAKITPFEEGLANQLMNLDQGQLQRMGTKIFSGESTTPAGITYLKEAVERTNPKAWRKMLRGFVGSKIDKKVTVAGEIGVLGRNEPQAIRTGLWNTEIEKSKLMAALPDEMREAFEILHLELLAPSSGRTTGSQTAARKVAQGSIENYASGGGSSISGTTGALMQFVSPEGMARIGRAIGGLEREQRINKLADIMLSGDFEKWMKLEGTPRWPGKAYNALARAGIRGIVNPELTGQTQDDTGALTEAMQ